MDGVPAGGNGVDYEQLGGISTEGRAGSNGSDLQASPSEGSEPHAKVWPATTQAPSVGGLDISTRAI
jgi:hypothetical protein